MNAINIIGILGSIGISISLIPQTIKTIKTENIKDLSVGFILITMVSSIFQNIFAIYYYIIPMIIANTSVFINTIVIFVYMIRERKNIKNKVNNNIEYSGSYKLSKSPSKNNLNNPYNPSFRFENDSITTLQIVTKN